MTWTGDARKGLWMFLDRYVQQIGLNKTTSKHQFSVILYGFVGGVDFFGGSGFRVL
jgi:hypothetical protein